MDTTTPNSYLERFTSIFDAFDRGSSRLTLEEVAHRTGLPRSTVHRILRQMVCLNWVDHNSSGYGLGRRVLGLDGNGHRQSEIRTAAAPLLQDLHIRTGMVVHLTILDGTDSVYLDKVGGRFATMLPSRVGGRVPAFLTAGGKSILAWLPPEQVDRLYEEWRSRHGDRPDAGIATLRQELDRVRRCRGLAYERGVSVRGVACVAAAVHSGDGPVAGISVSGDARTTQLDRVAPLVARAAREVSRQLTANSGRGRRRHRRPAEDHASARAI